MKRFLVKSVAIAILSGSLFANDGSSNGVDLFATVGFGGSTVNTTFMYPKATANGGYESMGVDKEYEANGREIGVGADIGNIRAKFNISIIGSEYLALATYYLSGDYLFRDSLKDLVPNVGSNITPYLGLLAGLPVMAAKSVDSKGSIDLVGSGFTAGISFGIIYDLTSIVKPFDIPKFKGLEAELNFKAFLGGPTAENTEAQFATSGGYVTQTVQFIANDYDFMSLAINYKF